MHPLKMLDADDRQRYDYLHEVLEDEFEDSYLQYHISGIITYELLNLLPICAHLFDEFGFPESENSRLLRYAITGTIAGYLEGEYDHGL
ncbi:MAG: hypothetical protein JST32_01775 [Bacteroidetes bacterium]|nr:hypothetical protein [Bacteroidota bacterium]